ncbi:DUF58 domain-containing protein [Scrofimicrobium sp. R131]|uniref:DUF58 domain-containing protein n=1 Tax=Scrofimicrobium appendicitidis TaxID=3079930 RepID=A0AAU7V7I7_9ACTO
MLHDYGKLVSLPVQRRLLTQLAGMHRGARAGTSHEFLEMDEYKVGDDVGDIDWKATARHNQPVVKQFEATAILSAYLLLDAGANMAAAASLTETKKQVALEFVTAICWLMRGDHLGLVLGNQAEVRAVPARSGTAHSQQILRLAERAQVSGPAANLDRLLRYPLPHRSMVLLVTDAYQLNESTALALRRLQARHSVFVFLVADLDPTEAGPGPVRDVGGALIPQFAQTNPTVAYQWANLNRARLQWVEQVLNSVPHATAASRAEVLPALLELFDRHA